MNANGEIGEIAKAGPGWTGATPILLPITIRAQPFET
jgi:hypothetical protein